MKGGRECACASEKRSCFSLDIFGFKNSFLAEFLLFSTLYVVLAL